MFSTKKVGAIYTCVGWPCYRTEPCGGGCHCLLAKVGPGYCARDKHVTKMVEEHPDLCESDADCTRKGSGSLCAFYPKSYLKYGWCFDTNSDAEASFKNALSSEFANMLKMP
ncbi:unnamed protein product [Vicia faba]|uniref:Albumin I chain a domain-containing protein n=1 Tax=Vicia faba TaxID=3906 RepID=A0AAV0ZRY6_VICFA|nr:unnamed protein product [Vicia faba]